jgi:glutathione peroxidase
MTIITVLLIFLIGAGFSDDTISDNLMFYDYEAKAIDGMTIRMDKYRGKKILIVNVASKCGFSSQYKDLQELHETYGENLAILGFPSNDFFWQEPGTNAEIQKFCRINYGVTFQMFKKIHVKGKDQHPIYKWLSDSNANGWNDGAPTWNFCKYLIDEKGMLLKYFNMKTVPTDTVITNYLIKNQKD